MACRYCDLVAKEGELTATAIRASKRELQAKMDPDSDEPPWVLKHPEMPTWEDLIGCMLSCCKTCKLEACLNITVMSGLGVAESVGLDCH